jgi:circadian clock protein KaiB
MKKKSAQGEFEEQVLKNEQDIYILVLYITGMTPNSKRAITNVRNICMSYLKDRYRLDIIDIYQQPQLAQEAQIIAAPTLVKVFPAPIRRLIGDMSEIEKVLIGLDINR